jgi:hypothetical protein
MVPEACHSKVKPKRCQRINAAGGQATEEELQKVGHGQIA